MSKGMLGTLSLSDVQGPRDDLEQKLAGEDGAVWLAALKRFLRKENPWEVAQSDPSWVVVPPFAPTVWEQVTLGLHPTVEAFRAALEQGGNQIGGYAGQIFVKTPLATERTTVDLYRVTGRDLGLTRRYTFAQLLAAGAKHNLGKLPAEAGPALRESYTDQPKNEWVGVVMDPIADSAGRPSVWRVDRAVVDRWLDTDYVDPAHEWNPEAVWVFGSVPSKQ